MSREVLIKIFIILPSFSHSQMFRSARVSPCALSLSSSRPRSW